jgi:hypothetical protein
MNQDEQQSPTNASGSAPQQQPFPRTTTGGPGARDGAIAGEPTMDEAREACRAGCIPILIAGCLMFFVFWAVYIFGIIICFAALWAGILGRSHFAEDRTLTQSKNCFAGPLEAVRIFRFLLMALIALSVVLVAAALYLVAVAADQSDNSFWFQVAAAVDGVAMLVACAVTLAHAADLQRLCDADPRMNEEVRQQQVIEVGAAPMQQQQQQSYPPTQQVSQHPPSQQPQQQQQFMYAHQDGQQQYQGGGQPQQQQQQYQGGQRQNGPNPFAPYPTQNAGNFGYQQQPPPPPPPVEHARGPDTVAAASAGQEEEMVTIDDDGDEQL